MCLYTLYTRAQWFRFFGQNWASQTRNGILRKYVSYKVCFSVFSNFGFKISKKYYYRPKKFFLQTFYMGIIKDIFNAELESIEKNAKKFTKTVIGRKLLHTVLKEKKTLFFSHFFADNFFAWAFQFFQGMGNQHQILHFLILIPHILKIIFFIIKSALIANYEENTDEMAQKTKN